MNWVSFTKRIYVIGTIIWWIFFGIIIQKDISRRYHYYRDANHFIENNMGVFLEFLIALILPVLIFYAASWVIKGLHKTS